MVSQRLDVAGVSKRFQAVAALDDVSLAVEAGELVSILGPSGCGKSTLLRVIAGLEDADAGTIQIGSSSVRGLPPKDREVAFVFQSYALYPHLTARQNLAAPLAMRELTTLERLPLLRRLIPGAAAKRRSIAARVAAIADLLQIQPLLARKPGQLSGGQRQRVALGRALIREPKLFLLDEPLANLDAALRNQTRSELCALQRRIGATTLFVTHDQSEAMAMSDRIVVMFEGRVRQVGSPDELYRHPADLDVARFLSQPHLNVVNAAAAGGGAAQLGDRRLAIKAVQAGAGPGVVAFRPEHVAVLPRGERNGLDAVVERAEHAGAEAFLFVRLADGGRTCVARIPSQAVRHWPSGKPVTLAIDPDAAWFFKKAVDAEPAARAVRTASLRQTEAA